MTGDLTGSKNMTVTCICIVGTLALVPDAKAGEPAADPIMQLKGKWQHTAAEFNGAKIGAENVNNVRLLMNGAEYVIVTGKPSVYAYKIAIDKNSSPNTIDFEGALGRDKGRKFQGIIKFHDAGFTVCRDTTGQGPWPTEFTTTGKKGVMLEEYKRSDEGFTLADDLILLQGQWAPVKDENTDKRAGSLRWLQMVNTLASLSYVNETS